MALNQRPEALLQVHHHCSPRQLLELLVSNVAISASNTTGQRIESATAEGELLQQAREALGARHVVRICGRDKVEHVSAALKRLVDNADTIRNSVNLGVRDCCSVMIHTVSMHRAATCSGESVFVVATWCSLVVVWVADGVADSAVYAGCMLGDRRQFPSLGLWVCIDSIRL